MFNWAAKQLGKRYKENRRGKKSGRMEGERGHISGVKLLLYRDIGKWWVTGTETENPKGRNNKGISAGDERT